MNFKDLGISENITNVLLNSPTEGYAIFADMMMK